MEEINQFLGWREKAISYPCLYHPRLGMALTIPLSSTKICTLFCSKVDDTSDPCRTTTISKSPLEVDRIKSLQLSDVTPRQSGHGPWRFAIAIIGGATIELLSCELWFCRWIEAAINPKNSKIIVAKACPEQQSVVCIVVGSIYYFSSGKYFHTTIVRIISIELKPLICVLTLARSWW